MSGRGLPSTDLIALAALALGFLMVQSGDERGNLSIVGGIALYAFSHYFRWG